MWSEEVLSLQIGERIKGKILKIRVPHNHHSVQHLIENVISLVPVKLILHNHISPKNSRNDLKVVILILRANLESLLAGKNDARLVSINIVQVLLDKIDT